MKLKLDDLRQLVAPSATCSLEIGKQYLIRTVTLYYTGRVAEITDCDVVLEDAAWIAETGRFHDALKTGELLEVEPFVKPVGISRNVIVDFTQWSHPLPREQK